MIPYQLRFAADHDEAFLADSWLRSYRHSPETSRLTHEEYWRDYGDRVRSLLKQHTVLVLTPEDWHEGVLGWICYHPLTGGKLVVHYGYVKNAYRRRGLGTALLSAIVPGSYRELAFTHLRPPYTDMLRRRGFKHEPIGAGA